MCGICGAVGFDTARTLVEQMNRAMVHRGPDSSGLVDDGRAALGIRRLRIIDLCTGDQPIHNQDRTVAIVCNGEIYNYRELYRELQARGHRFTTHSDTETILHAYEEWGKECLGRLRGMFAFAIYDRRSVGNQEPMTSPGQLFLARDRLGVKPLYVWCHGHQLLFASEVRSLLATGLVPKRLSAPGLYTYLAFGSVQEPLTMIEGVSSLSPGTWLQVQLRPDGLQSTSGVYWQPPADGEANPELEQVRGWLADAVNSHLVSDVPLGAFLSGGLDSGSLVALATEALGRSMQTFTLAFNDWPDDERPLAELTARRWSADHQTRLITADQVLADLPRAIASMDQPTVDGLNTWYVSREARRAGLTVALSGVGGDELFAGYPSFRQVPRLKGLPRPGRWYARAPIVEEALGWLPGRTDTLRKLGAFLDGQTPFDHPYFAVRGLFTVRQIRDLLRSGAVADVERDNEGLQGWQKMVQEQLHLAGQYDSVGEVSWLELSQYMRSTLLRDTDVMSMAHSLEVRVPFVDHLLVERVLPVRESLKLNGHRPKPLLADTLGNMLLPEVTGGAKRTFTFPFETWLRREMSLEVSRRLQNLPDGLRGWVESETVDRIWSDFKRGRTNWARPWALYVLDEWTRKNL
jgi:asparagine synthase (glutamine-hydrolysing)